jgi:D-cysteine desulfhydrase family pyridoxal phosphate-dependent enzyme
LPGFHALRPTDRETVDMHLTAIPRQQLATLPTPLERAHNLERALGSHCPRIYLKRDDLTGLAFGGNKARKLEYLLADALALDATVLVTEGAAQSNHARITAAAAATANLRCVLVLDARHGSEIGGNLLLDQLLGAEVRIVPGKPERKAEMARVAEELRAAGESPYLIPTGGSVPLGAAAYVAAVAEMLEQLMRAGDAPSRLYAATGSLGTQAGLVVGARAFTAPFSVYGVAVEQTVERLVAEGVALANATATRIGLDEQFAAADIAIDGDFIGPGYGLPTEEGLAAIRLLARTEAVFLDPVYSGKAMAALISHVQASELDPDGAVIFLHTGGGPSIFPFGAALL